MIEMETTVTMHVKGEEIALRVKGMADVLYGKVDDIGQVHLGTKVRGQAGEADVDVFIRSKK